MTAKLEKLPIPVAYPDRGPRVLSQREIDAIDGQAITVRYPDDWTPQRVK